MTDTIISDSGVKYDIGDVVTVYYPGLKWKHTGAIKSIKEWNDGSITYDIDGLNIQVEYDYIQKFSQSREEKEESTKCDHSFDTALLRNPPIYVCSKCGLQGTGYNASCVGNGGYVNGMSMRLIANAAPVEREKKDFGEAIEIIKGWHTLIISILDALNADGRWKEQKRSEISHQYQRLLSILSSK